ITCSNSRWEVEWTSPSVRPSRRSPRRPPTCWTAASRGVKRSGRSSARPACSGSPCPPGSAGGGPGGWGPRGRCAEGGRGGGPAPPAWRGGDGLGVLDTAVLLTEVGRRAAPVPALATLAMGVLPVTRWGTRELQLALLDGVAAGDTILTAAVREPSDPMPPAP